MEALPRRQGQHRRSRHAAPPARQSRPDGRERPARQHSVIRIAVCVACLALAVVAWQEQVAFRGLEARLAGSVIHLVTHMRTGSSAKVGTFWFSAVKTGYIGLQITPECTVALLTLPFLLATACLAWLQPRIVRPVAALVVAVAMLLAMNQLRFAVIAYLIKRMGVSSGFYWGHTLIGSIITIGGLAAVLATFAMIAVTRGRRAT
jgi:exosortase/archaeosortase family protein